MLVRGLRPQSRCAGTMGKSMLTAPALGVCIQTCFDQSTTTAAVNKRAMHLEKHLLREHHFDKSLVRLRKRTSKAT